MRVRRRSGDPWQDMTVEEMAKCRPCIPFTGYRYHRGCANPAWLRVLIMTQADGHYTQDGGIRFHFKKVRKIERCKMLLRKAGIPFVARVEGLRKLGKGSASLAKIPAIKSHADSVTGHAVQIDIPARAVPLWLREFRTRTFGFWLLDENPDIIFDELPYWDGYYPALNSIQYCTTVKQNADIIQALAHMSGRSCVIKTKPSANTRWKSSYVLDIWLTPGNCHEILTKPTVHEYCGKVYCAVTQTGYFLVRRNGKVWITGNSGRLVQLQNVPQNHLPDLKLARDIVKRGDEEQLELLFGSVPGTLSELIRTAFIPRDGCRFIVADFSAIEARVLAWLAGEEWVLDEFRGKGKIYEATASRMFHVPQETIVKGHPNYEYRQKGKQATLSCIAEGQLVLTDQGLVPIEQVQLYHKVWDGENWVSHEGLVYRGRRETLDRVLLTATADHLVWVKGQTPPIPFEQAAANELHLAGCGQTVQHNPNTFKWGVARVYDLRNAGPHHRFTVSGKLVHNCGYGGGVGALKAMGAKMPEEEMQPLVDAWRAANPHIVQFWYALGNAASEVIEKRNSVRVGKVKVYWRDNRLLIRLPGGRDLCYLSPRFVTNRFGSRGIGYLAAGASGKMELQETFGGKIAENCLAEGTLVITNCGLVPIECISASHLIWDGEAFVHHEGVLSKGIQATIFVDGIWMTPEHKILTGEGMVACEQSEGLNWASVQLPDGFEKRGKQQTRQTNVEMQMRLWERSCDSGILSQPKGQKISSAFLWLYEKQIDQQGEENARNEPPSSIRCLAFYETTMRRSKSSCVPQLWGTWNQGLRRMAAQLRNVLARYGANVQEGPGTGSDRQQQRVLRGKLPLGGAQNQCPEPQSDEDNRHPLWQNVGGGVMRTNEYWRDNDAVSIGSQVADRVSVCQARLPQFVYDIRNCGPRHRFAVWANGRARVVSNCTQAIARDLLAHAMLNLEAAGYPIVFHVHDEAVMEVPIGQGSVEEACRIMAIPPDWARDLPLRADGEEMEFYRK